MRRLYLTIEAFILSFLLLFFGTILWVLYKDELPKEPEHTYVIDICSDETAYCEGMSRICTEVVPRYSYGHHAGATEYCMKFIIEHYKGKQ